MSGSKPKVLAVIPARGGSKGIPRKNIKSLNNKPLVQYSIEASLSSFVIDKTIVSTEDNEIASFCSQFGDIVPFMRPVELADDLTDRNSVVEHALSQLPGFDYVILLQPTSPLRTFNHIDEAFKQMIANGSPACVSVSTVAKHPSWMFSLSSENTIIPFIDNANSLTPRQGLQELYALNGALFISSVPHFLSSDYRDPFLCPFTSAYTMNVSSSLDIDSDIDWLVAERLMQID